MEKVHEIIGIDANFTTRILAEELNTSNNTISRILTEDLGKRKVCARFISHQLNAPPHKTKKVNEFLMKKRISLINHPPYSPDLSSCDYFLFPKLKTKMKGAFLSLAFALLTRVKYNNSSCIKNFLLILG